jgi:tripartite-type tricarboxylate transporter receptor subunit TctC
MLSNSTPTSIGPFTVPKPPYDPVKQFTHVGMLGVAPVLIMANPKTGPASLKDLPKAPPRPATPSAAAGRGRSATSWAR